MSAPAAGVATAPGAPGSVAGAPVVVVGDGTTPRDRAARRWRRARGPLVVLALLVAGGLLALLPAPRQSTTPLAPDNAGDNGARAVAEILGRHGVEVDYVRTAGDAVSHARDGGTLLVAGDFHLTEQGANRLAAAPGDLVLAGATMWLSELAPGVATDFGAGSSGPREAACDDEDALAAGTTTAGGALVALTPDTVVCFPDESGRGAYAVMRTSERRVTVLADAKPLTNAALTEAGNAALVLRMLGRDEHLVWYVPSATDTGEEAAGPSAGTLVPPWARVLGLELVLVAVVVALWRGRRHGPVVAERLPVVVPAAETTRGRGRLYRRSRSYGHAAAALRAGAATRMAARLGLPRSADAAATTQAVARATGRPEAEVAGLLYGPPPADDRSLAALATELDHLESEVHRS